MKTRRVRKIKRRKTRGGYKQYLSNIGFSTGYSAEFDRNLATPSANRTTTNWV
jgi:hypothetical protein